MDSKNILKNWKAIPSYSEDKILYMNALYKKDQNPQKVNLTIGAYKDNYGKPIVLSSVSEATRRIFKNPNCAYIPPIGDREFTELAVELAYGVENGLIAGQFTQKQVIQAQSLSGAGGLLLAFNILKEFYIPFIENQTIWIPDPSWANHEHMIRTHGFKVKTYRYYDLEKREFTFEKMLTDLKGIPENSVVLFHPVGHNPTGFDPSQEQWNLIFEIAKKKNFFNLFDMAYQGFVSGDIAKDAYVVRLFARNKLPLCVSQSMSKNFGLYGHRIGCLSMPNSSEKFVHEMNEFLRCRIRRLYSSNPRFGSDVIKTILGDRMLKEQWKQDIQEMSTRIKTMRQSLYNELKRVGVSKDWSFVVKQQGMFAFTTLTKSQVIALRNKYAVYLLESGRISMSGINTFNARYVAEAIKDIQG